MADAFVFRLRPFVLERERTHFKRITALVGRLADDSLVHLLLRIMRDLWSGKFVRSAWTLTDKAGPLNSDESLMKWLNSHEYHRDPEKRQRFDELKLIVSDDVARAIYLMLLLDKAKAVVGVEPLCQLLMAREGRSDSDYRPCEETLANFA